ncbi:MAG: adenylate/guanylate cyclase domain-containing protein, partial [Anaerolineales bacterium]
IVLEDLTEQRRLQAQRRLFERMVSPAVIDELDPDSIHFGGQRAQITTLFADLRGYTSFSEKTPPEVLVSVLNRYLAQATEALLQQEATIDKFLGDAVMAWFNAPVLQDNHIHRAARAALAIRKGLADLHQELPPQWHLSFGIGIHTGEALLGLVGAQERLEYTAVGESVNLAKRLQEAAAAGQILISQGTAEALGSDFDCRPVPPLSMPGISKLVQAMELIGQRS